MIFLNPSGAPAVVREVAGFDMRVGAGEWPFALARQEEIERHWRAAAARNPTLFDGRVLVARSLAVEDGVVRATYVEIPFSALLFWRSLGFPGEAGAFNAFGAGVVVARDGAVLLARMGRHTSNAGRIFFPAGTPDPNDVRGDRLDIEASILRELAEETGIGADLARASDERWAVFDGSLVACARRIDVDLGGEELTARIRAFLASEERPELEDVVLIRSMADVDRERVPAYAQALLGRLVPT